MKATGRLLAALGFVVTMGQAGAASALTCQDPAGFDKWLGDVRREAVASGISPAAVDRALNGVTFDRGIISRDRGQRVFKQSFEQFSSRMINAGRLKKGAAMLRQHAALLDRLERQTGVDPAVLVALWGLETDFGVVRGNLPVMRSVATLAYDCRRTDFFQKELFAAIRLVARGDLSPAEMRGAWAGEMGQTQFMPSSYDRFAVDADGDGRRDLIRSSTDALASTANYLKGYGWQRGADWNPGGPNFAVLKEWNKSDVYSRTVALYASKLAGER